MLFSSHSFPSPAGLRKLYWGMHALDYHLKSSLITFDTFHISPGSIILSTWNKIRVCNSQRTRLVLAIPQRHPRSWPLAESKSLKMIGWAGSRVPLTHHLFLVFLHILVFEGPASLLVDLFGSSSAWGLWTSSCEQLSGAIAFLLRARSHQLPSFPFSRGFAYFHNGGRYCWVFYCRWALRLLKLLCLREDSISHLHGSFCSGTGPNVQQAAVTVTWKTSNFHTCTSIWKIQWLMFSGGRTMWCYACSFMTWRHRRAALGWSYEIPTTINYFYMQSVSYLYQHHILPWVTDRKTPLHYTFRFIYVSASNKLFNYSFLLWKD